MKMFLAAKDPRSRCAATGIAQFTLVKVGEPLEVDRIDPTKGYVRGNMQLLARSINNEKGVREAPPEWVIAWVRGKAGTRAAEGLSEAPTG